MGDYGTNYPYGMSPYYKDEGSAGEFPDPAGVGEEDGLLVSFSLAVLPTQGIGFSENTGDNFVFPFPGCSGFNIVDANDNERHLVIDSMDRCSYDIATKLGATGSGLVKRWKDKQLQDGTEGTDIECKVRFFDDLGTFENFLLRNATNHIFGRCVDPVYVDADGYDSNGMLEDTEWTLKLFADGERLVAERTASEIPLVNNVHFSGHEEAHRFAIELTASKSGHVITGRKMEYVVIDKYSGNNFSTENEIAEKLAYPAVWYSRRPTGVLGSGNRTLVDRVSGNVLNEVISGTINTIAGPASLGGYGIESMYRVQLSGAYPFLMFIAKNTFTVYADSTLLTPVEHGTVDGWTVYTISGIPSSDIITIRSNAGLSAANVYDIRQFSDNLTSDEIAFYAENIIYHNGDVVLP